ncbi:MAG TPA: LysM domain-containing protein [Allosphingosinicella sp.]|jgi:hypothetical protein
MADEPLAALAAKLQAQASAPDGILLDESYLTAPLGPIAAPDDFDARLAQAFHPGAAGGLQIVLTGATFGPVTAEGFTVSGVALGVLGGKSSAAVLTFGVTAAAGGQQMTLTIAAPAPGWTWPMLSGSAAGWPFKVVALGNPVFTFDTTVSGAVQAVAAQIAPPAFFADVVELVVPSFASASLPVAGALDFAAVDGEAILFPTGVLTAPLGAGSGLSLLFLKVANPAFTLDFPAADSTGDQSPLLAFQLDLDVENDGQPIAGYRLTAPILAPPPAGSGGQPALAAPSLFTFALSTVPGEAMLTPATVATLMGGASYFEVVPAQFQQFLTLVGLRGLSVTGGVTPPAILQIVASIGANPKTLPWVIFKDGDNGLTLEVDDLQMTLMVSDPTAAKPQQSVVFTTQMTFLPSVFKGSFFFEITTDLEFDARFDGTATLQDLVSLGSAGLISLPDSVAAALSDVHFHYSHTSRAYAISAGISVDLGFVTISGKSLFTLTAASIAFSATPPATGADPSAKTIYTASFAGLVTIGPVGALASIDYDSGTGWNLSAAATAPIDLGDLIEEVFTLGGKYSFPPFLKPDLEIETLDVTAAIPADKTDAKSYTVDGSFDWNFTLAGHEISELEAKIHLAYADKAFSGKASASLYIPALKTTIDIAYAFDPAKQSQTLSVTWEGVTATYDAEKDTQSLTFTLSGWSVGSLITALAKTIPGLGPYFTLPAPFDLLNDVSLDGMAVTLGLGDSSGTISARYDLSSAVELGFVRIAGVRLTRFKDPVSGAHKMLLQLKGSSPVPGIGAPFLVSDWDSEAKLAADDAAPPGQDVTDLPDVPGRGNEYFDLCLFAMGQRVTVEGLADAPDVKSAILLLADAPSTGAGPNPVPAVKTQGLPYYDRGSDWLIASRMLILKAGGDWTIDLSFIFNDPNLYGLHLKTAGAKAKALAGLELDILYKKVTDEIGMYQVDWHFPDSVRNLNFGAVAVTLPDIGVQIYTNGDFLIDIGFPYKMDFSRSFSFSAIVGGIPVTGGGGVYFGKLSAATSTVTPVTQFGTFHPVIVFGLGFRVGLGYNFTAGPLTAGFALTAFAMIEGVIAPYHPYQPPAAGGSVQHDYYFKITGTAGIIGLLYGSIDFAIIKASLSVNITLSISLTYESFQPMEIDASASVSVTLSVSIDLGLFSITFHLSFHADVSASFVVHIDDGVAPWVTGPAHAPAHLRAMALRALPPLRAMPLPLPPGQAPAILRSGAKPAVTLYATAAFTVLAPEVVTDRSQQTAAYVALLFVDAPVAANDDQVAAATDTSFGRLCYDLLPWLVADLSGDAANPVDLDTVRASSVTRDELNHFLDLLANLDDPPLNVRDFLTFLSSFAVGIEAVNKDNQAAAAASALFPVFDGLVCTAERDGKAETPIDFSAYVSVSADYRKNIATLFEQLTANIEKSGGPPPPSFVAAPAPAGGILETESMAALLFVDAMMLVGRQLVQAAINALGSFTYATANGNTIAQIVAWSGAVPIGSDDIVLPNAAQPLIGGTFAVEAPGHTVQAGESLAAIAGAYQAAGPVAPADLIANDLTARIVAAGVSIGTLQATTAGMSFADILAELGPGATAQQLAETVVVAPGVPAGTTFAEAAILVPGAVLKPLAAVTVGAGTSLATLASVYGVTVKSIGADPANAHVPLFQAASISLTNVGSAPLGDLWSDIASGDHIAQISGMLTRFLGAGLRLPTVAGSAALEFSAAFNAVNGLSGNDPQHQSEYSAYQLTGQQFPAPADLPPATGDYKLALSALAVADGVAIDFLTFDAGGTSIDLAQLSDRLGEVLSFAQAGSFNPPVSFRILPAAARQPQLLATKSPAAFATTDLAALALITAPPPPPPAAPQAPAPAPAPAPPGPARPAVWAIAQGALDSVAARQAALERARVAYIDQLQYLPLLTPQALATDPATKTQIETPLASYAWATRIDFSVKRLPPAPAAGAAPAARAFTYEVIGLDAPQAVLLERLLVALAEAPAKTQPISGLYVGLPQGSGADARLLVHSASEVLAFFNRTNLSTETNPPPMLMAMSLGAEPAPPPPPAGNLKNPPAEAVRLLWELSTVRSGGYFLSYETVPDGAGLPDSAFDSTGKAQLALIITYPRTGFPLTQPAAADARLTDFVNALLTDDPWAGAGVQIGLLSGSAPTQSQALEGASLNDLAAQYGLSVGRLAELNETVPLAAAPPVPVPIGGAVHLVTPADMQAGDADQVLAAIAQAYSANLTTPLAAADLSAANPGVAPAAGVALYIPPSLARNGGTLPVTYKTQPGDTLASIAALFGLSVADLATTASAAPLFDGQVTIDPLAFDVHPSDGPGNITFELERTLPSGATSDPDVILNGLYSMLSAGILGNRFFTPSRGLPFGPQRQIDPMDPDAARAAARQLREMRDPAQRRQMLTAATADPIKCYRQTLGLAGIALSNAAPAGGSGGIPVQAQSPYAGVGALAQLDLEWRDLFGNVMITPFDQPPPPPATYQGPVEGQPVPLLYRDKLIGPAAWPGASFNYVYSSSPSPNLTVTLGFSTAGYQDDGTTVKLWIDGSWQVVPAWQAAAQRDYELYCKIWFQLNEDYTGSGIPWADGQAVKAALTNSLFAQPLIALSDTQAQPIRDYVAQALAYLDQRRSGGSPSGPSGDEVPTIVVPVSTADVAPGDVLPLALTMTLSRQGLLVDSVLAGLADGETAAIDLLPQPDPTTAAAASYLQFAQAIERIFVTDSWALRVGSSMSKASSTPQGDKRTQNMWAVRLAVGEVTATSVGLGFALNPIPLYYAPLPIATSLVTQQVDHLYPSYVPGQSFPPPGGAVPHCFTGIDPGAWFQSVLDAVDAALAPDIAAALYLLDLAAPSAPSRIEQLLGFKQQLADALAATVRPILQPGPDVAGWPTPDRDSDAAAGETLRQALLNRLGPAYAATAIVQFSATQVTGPSADAGGPIVFYGAPQMVPPPPGPDGSTPIPASAPGNQNCAMSSARLALDPSRAERLGFLFDSRNASGAADASENYVAVALQWTITHVEHERRSIPAIDGYVDSDWISLLTGPIVAALGDPAGIDVPVVLRALPEPPTMQRQSGVQADASGVITDPAELALWDYSFDFLYQRAAQDTIDTIIELNLAAPAPPPTSDSQAPLPSAEQALIAALAQFVQVYPEVETAMAAGLAGLTTAAPAAAQPAINPVQWFLAILGGVADAFTAWSAAQQPAHFTAQLHVTDAPLPVTVAFKMELVDEGEAVTELRDIAINGLPATLDPGGTTISAGTGVDAVTLPVPLVDILPALYRPNPLSDAGAAALRFNYLPLSAPPNAAPLTYAQAQSVAERRVTMAGLNIFGFRNGSATLKIERNLVLFPETDVGKVATSPAFVFSTPAVQFATPAHASLVYATFDLANVATPATTNYDTYLSAFFTGLAKGQAAVAVEAAATATYSYSLMPSLTQPRTVVPVALMLHTPATLSATAAPSFVPQLAAAVDSWRIAAGPTTAGGASIDLALAIYPAGDGDLQPMLRIESITLSASAVPPQK